MVRSNTNRTHGRIRSLAFCCGLTSVGLLCAASTSTGAMLIDSTTLNGSFESGVASPWGGGGSVARDPSFASQGDWYAILPDVAPGAGARQLAYQDLLASPSEGLTFIATFDARNGTTGYDSGSVQVGGQSIFPPSIVFPNLSSSGWQTYQA